MVSTTLKFFFEETISPKTSIYFFVNFDSDLIQTQILTSKLTPNLTLTQTLILNLKKILVHEMCAGEYFLFSLSFYSL